MQYKKNVEAILQFLHNHVSEQEDEDFGKIYITIIINHINQI